LSDIRSDISQGFDKILVSASSKDLPKVWKDQLKTGGTMVAPIGNSIWKITKTDKDKFEEEEFPGFIFSPFSTLQQMTRVIVKNRSEICSDASTTHANLGNFSRRPCGRQLS
jgi:protein-L-isoaspartate O-methyltransferase